MAEEFLAGPIRQAVPCRLVPQKQAETIAAYEKLLEDLEDLAMIVGCREEPTITHDQFVAELMRDGVV